MKKLKEMLKNEKGFTLIELLAVIVILGIIAAIAVPSIGNLIASTEDDAHNSNALSLIESARLANVSGEAITDNVGESGKSGYTVQNLVDSGFLDAIPQNPATDGNYSPAYVVVEDDGDGSYTYKVTLGDISNMTKSDLTSE